MEDRAQLVELVVNLYLIGYIMVYVAKTSFGNYEKNGSNC